MSRAKKDAPDALVAVRLLSESSLGHIDQVVELDQERAAQAVADGVADASPEAVEYARLLAKQSTLDFGSS